ncbi:MAG: AbrB/MazE/SpoVT family DNA-binding domain-containing protein [Betaproteobacteria bacterium]|nr:AbrB/MazE/SpoVT family DNA-binding domain-containing protein [Betaproteobacteria bacterium]MBK8741240.1 AbrB/MazE/SpoVT family DNA-binding domain-containing protein [Betaproteobacteria bacterium]MBK9608598.1 AbrB/MazE/SpoVT family DNA-binding domain-containing protein [Betaproteobacteria bacterium]
MITVTIRRQGGAAVMTIPSDVLKLLDVKVGSTLQLEVVNGAITVRPAVSRKRYLLAELLRGVTPAMMASLNADTALSRKGQAVGRELA